MPRWGGAALVAALLLLSCGRPRASAESGSRSDECLGGQDTASDRALQVLRQEIAKEVREAIEEEVRAQVLAEVRAAEAQGGLPTSGGAPDSKRATQSESTSNLAHLVVASDPDVRAMCMTLLNEKHSVWSQFNQDTFVFHNYLAVSLESAVGIDSAAALNFDQPQSVAYVSGLGVEGWLCQSRGNAGVYVDVGAHEPLEISNTAFFDLCLGWKGLCIEMR